MANRSNITNTFDFTGAIIGSVTNNTDNSVSQHYYNHNHNHNSSTAAPPPPPATPSPATPPTTSPAASEPSNHECRRQPSENDDGGSAVENEDLSNPSNNQSNNNVQRNNSSHDINRSQTSPDYIKEVTKFLQEQNGLLHSMDRGYVMIINNEEFPGVSHLKTRLGSEQDITKLKHFFEDKLDFEVRVKRNKKAEEMQDIIKGVSELDFAKYESMFMFILSHGCEQGIYGTDGGIVNTEEILQKFTADKCKSLATKPKIFFFQACRVSDIATDAAVFNKPTTFRIPKMSNFLTVYPYAAALRSESQGSVYIGALIQMLEAFYDRESLTDILLRVNYKIARYNDISNHTMMPCVDIRLRQKCYFKKFFRNIYEYNGLKETQ